MSEPKYKQALKKILADTDIHFLRWAIDEIAKWDNSVVPTNMVRIHGSSDRLLTASKVEKLTVLPNAGHFMIMNRARELSQFLNKELKDKGN